MNTNTLNPSSPYLVATYLIYLAASVALTVWVARTLHKNGRIFLVDSFHGNEPLADSVNHLLVVGFYLINIGFIALALKTAAGVETVQQTIEVLSRKLGLVMLVLGIMHFFNILMFSRMRNKVVRQTPPALPPFVAPGGPTPGPRPTMVPVTPAARIVPAA